METDNVLLIVCIVLGVVGLLNVGLLLSVLRGGGKDRFEVIGRAIQSAQNPWREDNERYQTLRQLVTNLGETEVEDDEDGPR